VTNPIVAAAQFLQAQLPWLRHASDEQGTPLAVTVFAEIADCAARLRGLVDGPQAGLKYLGPCKMPLATIAAYGPHPEQYVECNGTVRWRPGSVTARCDTCKTEHDPAQRQAWIDDVRREFLYTATEIAEAYPDIKANTISKWASRGLLEARGKHGNSPLYLVGDVLDMAAGDAARREEARARRAARQSAEMGA